MSLPDFSMKDRVALLTGAARGIGLAIAQAFVASGAAVAIQDIDLNAAEAEAQKIRQAGGKAIAIGGDVTDVSIAPQLVQETVDRLGALHVLVNNAAIQDREHWLVASSDRMRQQIDADLLFPIVLTRQVVPILQKQKWGRIVNIGSIQQRKGNPDMLAYSLSKAALEKFTIGLARGLARDNVTVNLIGPGWFNTLRNEGDFKNDQELAEKGQKYIPMGRIGDPRDCAGLAVLLCSEAGSYITGQSIYVDGGLSA